VAAGHGARKETNVDWKLELVAIPVSDVDRAKTFYTENAGFNADEDHTVTDEIRFVQLTPPGSACSIMLGTGLSDAAPGSVKGMQLVVSDIHARAPSSSSVGSRSATFRSSHGARSSSSATPTATSGRCSSCRRGTRGLMWVRSTSGWGPGPADLSRFGRRQGVQPCHRPNRTRSLAQTLPSRTSNPHQASRSIRWT